ncbi:MAG: glycosyltransferase [Proteobacteria bacterium]|nr:glycosyltransferase [Pseudomonadota bacterium]
MNTTRSPRIGIPFIADSWLGGVNYVIHLFLAGHALPQDLRPRLILVVPEKFLKEQAVIEHQRILPLADSIIARTDNRKLAEQLLGPGVITCGSDAELFEHIDYLFPVHSDVLEGWPAASWIPDFQHRRLPHFCPRAELEKRDVVDHMVAERARLIVFSSEAAQSDFRHFFPESRAMGSILHFTTIPEESWYQGNPEETRSHYGLPKHYLICCNQFWIHKDHKTLFSAISVMKRMGRPMHLVCTGPTHDYRHKGYFDEIKVMLKVLGIEELVHILGRIDRDDQIQLLRGSLAVVQPSLFEGWSTVVEDCRVLGKTLFLSDIDVHQEQAPEHGIYFKAGDAADLTQKILTHSRALGATQGTTREEEARRDASKRIGLFGLQLLRIAKEGLRLFTSSPEALSSAVQEPPRQETLTITTSIAPKGIEKQQAAVRSWVELGFAVESLNSPEEIPQVAPHFPEVRFVPVARNARETLGKPLVYLDDLFAHFSASGRSICGVVNSDIILRGAADLTQRLRAEAKGCFVFGSRLDVADERSTQGRMYDQGFDFFFFDRSVLPLYKQTEFCLGAPWWDYWIAFVPILAGIPTKQVRTPTAYHPMHELAWSWSWYVRLAREVIRGIEIPGLSPEMIPLEGWTNENLQLCRNIAASVLEQIQRCSLPLHLDEAQEAGRNAFARWPRITIVTPSLNQGGSIEKTIRSVLEQGYPNLEYIVMDGGSTDQSVEIIRKYESRIDHWESQPDGGQSDAIGKGLALASGEIFNWLNSDDWLEPGALHRVAEAWREHPHAAGWVGACRRMDPEGNELDVVFPNSLGRSNLGQNWNGKQIYQPACFIDTALAKRFGVDAGLDYCMDQDLYFQMLEQAPFVSGRGVWAGALIHPEAKTTADREGLYREVIELQRRRGFAEGAQVRENFCFQGGLPGFITPDDIRARLKDMHDPAQGNSSHLKGLRVAVLSNFLPRPDASAANHRLLQVIRLLQQDGAELDYFYFFETSEDERYARELGLPARRLAPSPQAVVQAFGDTPPDILWQSNLWTPEFIELQTQTMLAVRQAHPGTKIFFDTMDLHSRKHMRRHLLSKDQQDLKTAREFLTLEREAYPRADRVLVVSTQEREAVLAEIPGCAPVSVIPNIHTPVMPAAPMHDRRNLVFLGNYSVKHNVDAARNFVNNILPHILKCRADIRLHLVGRDAESKLGDLRSPHVHLVDYVSDLAAALSRYKVFVCPMAYGTGLKGKLGMAASVGLPIVTTSIGAEGFGFTDGVECFIADDHEEFALKTLQVYDDRVTWNNFSLQGVLAVAERFSPWAVSANLSDLCRQR